MTYAASTLVLGFGAATGLTAAVALPTELGAIPWKEIAGGSAAVLMFVTLCVLLRFLREERTARDAERQKDREHTEKLASGFTTSIGQLVQGIRDDQRDQREFFRTLLSSKRPT